MEYSENVRQQSSTPLLSPLHFLNDSIDINESWSNEDADSFLSILSQSEPQVQAQPHFNVEELPEFESTENFFWETLNSDSTSDTNYNTSNNNVEFQSQQQLEPTNFFSQPVNTVQNATNFSGSQQNLNSSFLPETICQQDEGINFDFPMQQDAGPEFSQFLPPQNHPPTLPNGIQQNGVNAFWQRQHEAVDTKENCMFTKNIEGASTKTSFTQMPWSVSTFGRNHFDLLRTFNQSLATENKNNVGEDVTSTSDLKRENASHSQEQEQDIEQWLPHPLVREVQTLAEVTTTKPEPNQNRCEVKPESKQRKIRFFGNLIQCPYCPSTYKYKKSLETHIIHSHEPGSANKLHCRFCGKAFKFQCRLEKHEKGHFGQQFHGGFNQFQYPNPVQQQFQFQGIHNVQREGFRG